MGFDASVLKQEEIRFPTFQHYYRFIEDDFILDLSMRIKSYNGGGKCIIKQIGNPSEGIILAFNQEVYAFDKGLIKKAIEEVCEEYYIPVEAIVVGWSKQRATIVLKPVITDFDTYIKITQDKGLFS